MVQYSLRFLRINNGIEFSSSVSYVKQNAATPQQVVLLDNGDILQVNRLFISRISSIPQNQFSFQSFQLYKYDAAPLEIMILKRPQCLPRVEKELAMPWLAANAISSESRKPAFKPYTVVNKDGVKIAVLGLTSPGIPHWLPKVLWPDMYFEDMIVTANYWVKYIQKKEKPHIIVGLFHSGHDASYGGGSATEPKNENASLLVAQQVPGFDIV
jgi:2',3'-cyclic-nucleotide 2'-phosphodiesterase/3'-nucleotidase